MQLFRRLKVNPHPFFITLNFEPVEIFNSSMANRTAFFYCNISLVIRPEHQHNYRVVLVLHETSLGRMAGLIEKGVRLRYYLSRIIPSQLVPVLTRRVARNFDSGGQTTTKPQHLNI